MIESYNLHVRSVQYKKKINREFRLHDSSWLSNKDMSIFVENTVDTIEDVSMHFGRFFKSLISSRSDINVIKDDNRKVIIIAGSGWAAHSLLKVIDTDQFRVVCVSPRPFFLFTPMLCSTSLGKIEYRSIVEPIRTSNPFVQYVEGEIVDINPERQLVKIQSRLSTQDVKEIEMENYKNNNQNKESHFNMTYDHFVFAVGATTGDFGVPGVREHCLFMKEIEDARLVKNRVMDLFELASLPTTTEKDLEKLLTFVIVGGGPTGIEFAGELLDFVFDDVSNLYKSFRKFVKVKVINAGKEILSSFDSDLQQQAIESVRQRGIDVRLSSRVLQVDRGSLTYSESGQSQQIEFGLCVWAAGTSARPVTTSLASLLGQEQIVSVRRSGRLDVDSWQRLKVEENGLIRKGSLFALGDCCVNKEEPLPQTAQVAAQQGAFLARLLNRRYSLDKEEPKLDEVDSRVWSFRTREGKAKQFQFLNLGSLAYIGGSKAIAQIRGGSEESAINIKTSGSQAYWLWRSVYVVKQVSTRTRVLVLFDIVKTFLFGRDLTSI